MTQKCTKCEEEFECTAKTGTCWCQELPKVEPENKEAKCMCPKCLWEYVLSRVEK